MNRRVHLVCLASHSFGGESLYPFQAGAAEVIPQRRIAKQLGHAVADLHLALRVEVHRCIPGCLGKRGGVRAGYGAARGHGFEQRYPEALEQRRKDKGDGVAVEGWEVLGGHIAQKLDIPVEAELSYLT